MPSPSHSYHLTVNTAVVYVSVSAFLYHFSMSVDLSTAGTTERPPIDVHGIVMCGPVMDAIHRAQDNWKEDVTSFGEANRLTVIPSVFGSNTFARSIGVFNATARWKMEDLWSATCAIDSDEETSAWIKLEITKRGGVAPCVSSIAGRVGGHPSKFVAHLAADGFLLILDDANPLVRITHQIPESIWSQFVKQ